MDNILHIKLKMDNNGSILPDDKTAAAFFESIKNSIPKNYSLIISPYDIERISGDAKIITIDCKEYSYNELKEMINKFEN